jgi:hypothetical protein
MKLPANATDAAAFGADVDGDATIDNQLGQILASFAATGADFTAASNDMIDRGEVVLLADLQTADLVNATRVGFTFFRGASPSPAPCTDPLDSICRRHLTGSGTFTVFPGSGTATTVVGALSAGAFTTSQPGDLLLVLPIGTTAVEFHPVLGRTKVTAVAAASLQGGTVAGAIPNAEFQSAFVPAFHSTIRETVLRDCTSTMAPDCGCMADSAGKELLSVFDEDSDCSVSLAEFQTNSLTASVFAPDVDTNNDGTKDAVSFGIAFTAVSAAFPQP